jgi:hypothetical protein
MKSFCFPLERVRRWREEQALGEELKLTNLLAGVAALRAEKRGIEEELAANGREILENASIHSRDLQALDRYRVRARKAIGEIEKRERQAVHEVEQQTRRTIDARRAAELLDRLKRKAFVEWQALAAREQETLAAELYLSRRMRKR